MRLRWFVTQLVSVTFLLAAVTPANGDTVSSDLLVQINSKITSDTMRQGLFQQNKYISVLPLPLESEGHYRFTDAQGLEWVIERPIKSKMVFDQTGIRQGLNGDIVWEISASQPVVSTIGRVISAVLSTDWVTLEEYFSISGSVDADQWLLELVPTDTSLGMIVKRIDLSGDSMLESMILHEVEGDRTELLFIAPGD